MKVPALKIEWLSAEMSIEDECDSVFLDIQPSREDGASFRLHLQEAATLRDWLTAWLDAQREAMP